MLSTCPWKRNYFQSEVYVSYLRRSMRCILLLAWTVGRKCTAHARARISSNNNGFLIPAIIVPNLEIHGPHATRRGRKIESEPHSRKINSPSRPSFPFPPSSLDNPLIWRRGDRSPLGRSALCRGRESWLIGVPFSRGQRKSSLVNGMVHGQKAMHRFISNFLAAASSRGP